jgi:hypothetical protein
LVVVLSVGEGGGFFDQVGDPAGGVVAGGAVGGESPGDEDVAGFERCRRGDRAGDFVVGDGDGEDAGKFAAEFGDDVDAVG